MSSIRTQIDPNVVCDPEALQISHGLKTHRREITSAINFVELEIYLASKGFLEDGEGDYFVTDLSQEEGVELILARVKERGDEGFKDFLWCLEQDNDWHIGHVYVAALLRGDAFTEETQREIEHSIKLRQKYRKQLDVMRIMEDSINTYDLIPNLRAYKLLTDDETEELTLPRYGRRERITKLLNILDTKGPLADLYFTQALKDAVRENPVHHDILERVYCRSLDEIMELGESEDIERDGASNSVSLGKRRRSLVVTRPYATKVPTSNPRQVRAHGIILSEEYFNRINSIRRLHYLGDWDGAEKIVKECRLLISTSKKRGDIDDISPTENIELYVAVALRNCSGYVTRKMKEKLLSIVGEAKELCKRIDNDNGRVLESKCEWMLAKMYRYSKDFDKAIEHIENAQLIHLRYNIAAGEDTTLCNYCKGCILASQLAKTKQWDESSKKFEEAKLCLRRATEHAAIQDFAIYQSHHMIRLAQLCLHSSQFEAGTCKDEDQITEAEAALNSHYIDEKVLAPRTKCLFYVTRSDLYRNKGKLTLAEEEAQRAKDIAMKNRFDTEIKSANVRLQALKLTTVTTVHGY
jgi:tetratricopeptide (TPR) repeat protein